MNYKVWKKTKENDKSIASGHQLRELRLVSTAEHGNAYTVRAMGFKYPGLKRQTVNDFQLAYLKLKKSKETADSDITVIVKKKTGRPKLLPKNLMKKVIETVTNLRLRGAPVSAAVIRAVARGVIIANDRSLLLENGGCIDLSTDWSLQVLYRFEKLSQKMTSRRATTAKIPIAPALLIEAKLGFINVKSRNFKRFTKSQKIS